MCVSTMFWSMPHFPVMGSRSKKPQRICPRGSAGDRSASKRGTKWL